MTNINSSTFGPIKFRSEVLESRILQRDSSGEFAEKTSTLELRFDPLSGQTCRLLGFPPKMIRRPDLSDIVQESLEIGCPFCPPAIDEITPRFAPELVPEGIIRKGEALVFPNARPYDVYSAVVVISREHSISLTDFTLEILVDALMAAYAYLERVQEVDSKATYHFIAWNYLPASGGSIVHPHLQCNIGYFPTFHQKQILEASQSYYQENGTNFWNDLVEQERKLRQRYIGTIGNTCWLTSFAPRGRLMDVMAIFPGKASIIELSEEDLRDFANGLLNVFRYMDELNVLSFNLSTYSGTDESQFWAHARITPRSLLLYSPLETSDQFYYQVLHDECICLLRPEIACEDLKRHFPS